MHDAQIKHMHICNQKKKIEKTTGENNLLQDISKDIYTYYPQHQV